MLSLIGKKVLVTTQNWFYAPDGKNYRAAWGTLRGVNEAGKTLGFIPNRSHANWFIDVGALTIMGCQVMYVLDCPEKPADGMVEDYTSNDGNLKCFTRPSAIYITA